jgi:hypothetical protein
MENNFSAIRYKRKHQMKESEKTGGGWMTVALVMIEIKWSCVKQFGLIDFQEKVLAIQMPFCQGELFVLQEMTHVKHRIICKN